MGIMGARLTHKQKMDIIRAKLRDNPKALAELDLLEYRDQTEWYLEKSRQEYEKIKRLNKHFLRR
jgi:hypothetical protein